ncbi:GroES-like protein [Fistulina hepatica ATCC 64428]|uniref:GroES-like protein n=1 Tax=Fistulina hepatica ATCC 64428 TaxID=1128425 RepID=A0A0D7A3W3_9AGAR|nr:GroES-like protein [Fistulina hepatica ATCC 64428]
MPHTDIPSTQFGVLTNAKSSKLQQFPVPAPGAGEVLIQNVAVASNPKDWKIPNFQPGYEAIEGNDVAGIVVAVGEGVSEYKVGSRVAAFTKMATRDNKVRSTAESYYGAYAQYSVAPASTTFPVPNTTSFEGASTLPLASMTAAIGLFKILGIPQEWDKSSNKGIIINGASTSVGSYAVQLAKKAGLFVIGIAGSSKAYPLSLGADVVLDYRQHSGEELISAIVESSGGRDISYAYDAAGLNNSTLLLARALAKTSTNGHGKVTSVLPFDAHDQLPKGVTVERTSVGAAYGVFEDFAAPFYRQISRWLATSEFLPNQVKIIPGGLAGVEEGLKLLKNGQVHGEKLVYRIADTPGSQ